MATGHPVDAHGRTLPRSEWPDDRHARGALEFVRRFCNTTNLESGADRLADADDFDAWLRQQGRPPIAADDADRTWLAELREVIRRAAVAHRDGESDTEIVDSIARRCASVGFRFHQRGSSVPLQPTARAGSAEHLAAELLVGIADAITAETWVRLTACSNCRWVVYDASKNRSVRWCSMSACGGRDKVRRHRARRRES